MENDGFTFDFQDLAIFRAALFGRFTIATEGTSSIKTRHVGCLQFSTVDEISDREREREEMVMQLIHTQISARIEDTDPFTSSRMTTVTKGAPTCRVLSQFGPLPYTVNHGMSSSEPAGPYCRGRVQVYNNLTQSDI